MIDNIIVVTFRITVDSISRHTAKALTRSPDVGSYTFTAHIKRNVCESTECGFPAHG